MSRYPTKGIVYRAGIDIIIIVKENSYIKDEMDQLQQLQSYFVYKWGKALDVWCSELKEIRCHIEAGAGGGLRDSN